MKYIFPDCKTIVSLNYVIKSQGVNLKRFLMGWDNKSLRKTTGNVSPLEFDQNVK